MILKATGVQCSAKYARITKRNQLTCPRIIIFNLSISQKNSDEQKAPIQFVKHTKNKIRIYKN